MRSIHKTDNTKQVLGRFRHINPAVAQADPILLIAPFVFMRLFHWRHLAWKNKKSSFLYIYADSGWHLAAGRCISVPLVAASIPLCSLQAPGTDPAGLPTPSSSRGLFISWQPQGPSYKHLSTGHATQLLFSRHVCYGPISLAEWGTATPNLLTPVQQLICSIHTFSEYGSLASKE